MSWRCATCDKLFETIPEDAVLITTGAFSRVTVYKIAGEVHSLRRVMSMAQKHKIWHGKFPRPDCIYCNPPPKPEPPVEQIELLQEVQAPEKSREPENVEEVKPKVAVESEIEIEIEEPMTAMAAAFRRIKS